ncbi:MAG: hypothetical protein N4A37_10035 [Prolixibacteraceae bacterium]|nr:hypothetical protein [Prolixibacteraceae bacterium]
MSLNNLNVIISLVFFLSLISCEKNDTFYYDGIPQIQFTNKSKEIEVTPDIVSIEVEIELVAGRVENDILFYIDSELEYGSDKLNLVRQKVVIKKGTYKKKLLIPIDYSNVNEETKWKLSLVSEDKKNVIIAHRSSFELTTIPYDWKKDISGEYTLSFNDQHGSNHVYNTVVEFDEDQTGSYIKILELPVWSFYGGPKKFPQIISFKLGSLKERKITLLRDRFLLGSYNTYKDWFLSRNYGDFVFSQKETSLSTYDISSKKIILNYITSLSKGRKYVFENLELYKN